MVDSLINPLFQFKMPLLDGLVASTALSNPQTMSNYLEKQTPHYTEAYYHYDPRAKEGSQFTPPWSSSKTSLLDGRGSTSHLSSMEGKQHMFFRQNSNSSKEGTPVLSTLHAAPVKQGFTLYSKSPGVSSSTTTVPSVAVSKPRSAESDPTPQPGSPVYLAVPKPVYGHNPCCGELCCVRGRYSVEAGYARIPHAVYKHNWMQSDAEYGDSAEVQKKAQEALLQRRGLQLDAGVERMKRMEACSPGRARPLPPIINPNYSRYPCTFFGPFGEQSQQTPPRAYPNLFPSHHAYEHMTSEVYQEHSPMTKYGHVTQRPVFFYSQADVEVENRSQCKNNGIKPGEDGAVAVKHALPSPQEHFLIPRSLHSEATLPHFQHGALLQGFGYPCYGGPRLNVGVRQRVQPPPVVHANNVHFSPTNLCPDYHLVSATSLHEDSGSLGDGRSGANSSFFRVEQSKPPRCSNQPFVATSGITVNRLLHPASSLNRPGLQTPGLNVERFLSYSPSGHVRCPKLPSTHPISLASQLQPSLHHYLDQSNKAAHDQSNVQMSIKTESKPNDTTSCLSSLKRSNSQSSPPIKVKEETDLIEDEPLKKCKRMEEMETTSDRNATKSPPMPVIDTVFSLAPYQAHIHSSGVLHPGRTLHSTVLLENPAVQMQLLVRDERNSQNANRPLVCRDSKEDCVGSPAQKPLEEIRKPQDIKVEKEDFAENSVEQQGCPTTAGGQHSEEAAASSIQSLVVIKKCDPEELEMKPVVDNAEMSVKSTPDEGPVKASVQSSAEDARQQKPKVPSEPTEHRANYTNGLSRQKRATYNIAVPHAKCLNPPQAPDKPPVPPTTQDVPSPDVHLRVRKHFYELHHSLYKLISKSVFATSEQELRTLLSQLELTEIAYPSSKIKNMPSLLGVKPRELWFNEEVKSVFKELLKRLQEYTAQARCPFPHVMRTSTVFLPMLVLKELLFPMVQSSFIDQVLQEHKVELRPTTLSEEKILLQLHKRACSSRLRKLMSLKHLPDIYADLINILYYTCISKHLGKCVIRRRCHMLLNELKPLEVFLKKKKGMKQQQWETGHRICTGNLNEKLHNLIGTRVIL